MDQDGESPPVLPDITHLEQEIAELRANMLLMSVTVEKIYNVVKIIYWDNHRLPPQALSHGYRQTVRAAAKPPDLLRHVLTKSHARAATQEARADLITGSPPRKTRSRCPAPQPRCRVAYDLLSSSPLSAHASRNSSLEWAKVLPQLLHPSSSDYEGEEPTGLLDQLHEEFSGDILEPTVQDVLGSSVPLQTLPSRSVNSPGQVPKSQQDVPLFPDSSRASATESSQSLDPALFEKLKMLLSSGKLSPPRCPEELDDDDVEEASSREPSPVDEGSQPSPTSSPEQVRSRRTSASEEAAKDLNECEANGTVHTDSRPREVRDQIPDPKEGVRRNLKLS